MTPLIYHLHALSPLHCGVGQSASVVDLPIARAKATGLPIVPGSSLRGVLRQEAEAKDGDEAEYFFGPRAIPSATGAKAGATSVNDAHLLALPVRSLAGVVAYVTSPFILGHYVRDLRRAGTTNVPNVPDTVPSEDCLVPPDSVNLIRVSANDSLVVLEDLDLRPQSPQSASLDIWASWVATQIDPTGGSTQSNLKPRLVIVSDEVMEHLATTATEIRARIAIGPTTGVVQGKALWYEESLPAESVLWGIMAFADPSGTYQGEAPVTTRFSNLLPNDSLLQVGGNAGVGNGMVRFLH